MSEKEKPKAVVVGGSIAGVSCAHALISAGWDVVVLEKSCAPITGSPTGAGLGLDPLAQTLIQSWLQHPELLHNSTFPLTVDLNQATDSEKKVSWTLTRDEKFNFRAALWADLHGLLFNALPSTYFSGVTFSSPFAFLMTRHLLRLRLRVFFSDFKLRYTGYYAWRGVFDFSGNENSETVMGVRRAYPELGKCLYFDLGSGTHCVLYELQNKRLNWIWYVNQPEPKLQRNSATMKVSSEMVQEMLRKAEKVWVPELVRVMKETEDPFLNFIYDSDPLEQIFWDNVVLVGDAAHPTTPHGLRSTNMSVLDAAVLGKCIAKWGAENLQSALREYQSIRLPVVSKQVLHARRMGRIKQGLVLPDREPFDPKSAKLEDFQELQQKNMPFIEDVPLLLL
ncbi:hypothetical protein SLA2020_336570 [Shorea laevis]